MRDPERIDRIINKLRNYWKIYPDLRFNQMIFNMTYPQSEDPNKVFNIEDDEFEQMINLQLVKSLQEECQTISVLKKISLNSD